MYDKLFLILFYKIGILMMNKRINSLFKSYKSEAIHEDGDKIDYIFHNIILKIKLFSQRNQFLKYYTNDPTI